MRLVISLVGIVIFSVSGCKKPEEAEETGQDQANTPVSVVKLSLPIQRTITNKDGRKLDVTIVKRSATHITIIRDSDQKSFDLAIAKLSDLDRSFIGKLPVSASEAKLRASEFLESRHNEIRKLEEKLQHYNNELASGTLNGSQASMVEGKIERLNREIQQLQNYITEHQE